VPSNILNADVGFPKFTQEQSSDEKFEQITNYLYMLLEQLRYSMGNLDAGNFNESGLAEIGNTITEPLMIRLENDENDLASLSLVTDQLWIKYEDAEENIAELTITAGGLLTKVGGLEGEVSTLTQTSNALISRISATDGAVSELTQTVSGLASRVSSAEGNISTLSQTANALSTRVSSAEGNASAAVQTVNSLQLSVSNGELSSQISLYANGAEISSQSITLTGVVTFSSLETTGKSIINGDNITTGTIKSIDIEGSTFRCVLDSSGNIGGEIEMYYISAIPSCLAGGLRLDDQGGSGNARYRMFLYTLSPFDIPFALKIESAGSMSIDSNQNIYMRAYGTGGISITADEIRLIGNVYVNGVLIE